MMPESHFIPDQEVFDRAVADWTRDPTAMRASIIDTATDVYDRWKLMILATQEEAAFGCIMRGEPAVVIGPNINCPTCDELMGNHTTMMRKAFPLYQTERGSIWMGPTLKWVCEACKAPVEGFDFEPNMGEIKRVNN